MSEAENDSNTNILKQYEDLTPINLVDTVERYYHTFLPNQSKESLNILSSYKSKNNVKFQLLDFEFKKTLSPLLKPKIKNIQTMKIFGDYFFLSDNSGSLYMYSVSRESELKVMTPPGKIDYYVTSIDVSPNAEFVIGGYSNGYLILWETKKPSIMYTIKDLHTSKIIFGQFSQVIEKKKFEIISSDTSGKLLKIVFTNSLFKKSVQDFMIYQDDVPTYAITQFRPLRNKQVILGAFCNINKIRVYILRPVFVSFFEIDRPECYDDNCTDIPDISFGWGCEPLENDLDNTVMKLDETQRQNQILLAISWGQVIRIFSMNIKGEDMILNGDGPKCHFINNSPVIRLGFISPSIIYFFDKNAEIKIINTAYTEYGDYHQIKKGEFIYNKKALVEEGKIIDKDLIKINVSNNDKKELFCYRYFINNMSKCIYLCTQNGFYLGKVLNFDDCIYNVVKEDWLGALSLTIDIHQGNISSFPDIPVQRMQRIKLLKPFIITLLEKYINYNLSEENKTIDENDLIKCINVVIEFCIGIKEIEFLFKNVEKTFRKKGKNNLFYTLLEPFIFNDLLINDFISEESLISLYTSYKSNKSLTILQHLFTHLNYNCLFSSTIKKIAFKENLFSLMILIFSNCKGFKNLFLPIAKIYKVFEEKIGDEKNFECKSYVETFGNDHIKGINMMEESTEYIGHKLLWYIDMSLKGKKFSLGMDVNLLKFDKESPDYESFVAFIFYWILQENVFLNLIKFDSYSFLNVISLYFTDPVLLNIIKTFDFTQFNENMISKLTEENEIKFLKDSNPQPPIDNTTSQPQEQESAPKKPILEYNNTLAIMNYILDITKNISDFFINIDLSILIIKFAFKYSEKTPLPAVFKRRVTESFKKCLTFYDDYNKLKETSPKDVQDIFNCHKVNKLSEIKKNNFFYNEIYKALRDLIDSNYKWKKDDLNSILELGKNCPFTLVKIRLYEYTKDFSEVMNCYLDEENKTETHSEDVFAWLQRMFQSFSRKNEDLSEVDFKNLQQTVVDNVSKLAKLSIPKTNKIIKQFYGNDQKIVIIHKLDDAPLLQYEFIKQLLSPTRGGGGRLEEVKTEEKKEESEENDSSKNAKNESLCNILLLEIDLLIKLKKFKEVLPSVREKLTLYPKVYPKEKCLQKCLENNINDASVILYQSLDETEKAMELTRNSVEKSFEEFLKDKSDEKYEKFMEELNLRIKLCEETSEYIEKNNIFSDDINNANDNKVEISQKEIEDIWFKVLYQLYEFEKKGENDENIIKKMKENINQLLRKMCLHVKLRNIIEVVINKKEDSLFKDFQNILCEMIQSNNNFNRILTNTMIIMKNCAINSEEEMLNVCIKGSYYNNDKCDFCHKEIDDKKNEKIFCFGCGHQCHEYCSFNKGEEFESECPICREKEIIDEPIAKKIKNIINDDKEIENKINIEDNNKNKKVVSESRDEQIKKLNNYDNNYLAMIEEI